jgi:hypothetical protein
MKKIHKELFSTDFDEKDANFFYSIANPIELNSVVNEVSRISSQIRDQYIVQKIKDYIDDGFSVFAQYGYSHVVMQESALEKFLSD